MRVRYDASLPIVFSLRVDVVSDRSDVSEYRKRGILLVNVTSSRVYHVFVNLCGLSDIRILSSGPVRDLRMKQKNTSLQYIIDDRSSRLPFKIVRVEQGIDLILRQSCISFSSSCRLRGVAAFTVHPITLGLCAFNRDAIGSFHNAMYHGLW